ncbi:MAG: pyridoxamine 5'-phosphate oxidase family protein, partial [Pseudomonadota bacterium]
GRFSALPGIRLHATAGILRDSTQDEMRLFTDRVSTFKRFKGYKLLWSDMARVRELEIHRVDPVTAGPMTQGARLNR